MITEKLNCPPCFFWRSHTYQHCVFFLGLFQLVFLHCATWPISPSTDAALPPHSRLQTFYPPSAHFVFSSSIPSLLLHVPGCFSILSAFSSPSLFLRVLQWNAGGFQASSTELLQFILSHPVDLICIQESNLNSSFSFQIPGFSALRSYRTHSWSSILSPDATHANGVVVIIFVRQGLSFSELSLLNPYCCYVGINISLNDSSSLSFVNVYALPIHSSPTDGRTDSFSPSILSSSRNSSF